jgi:hypothetical protein
MPKDSAIKHFRSTTAGATPGGGEMQPGELAINLADKKLYCGDITGTSHFELTRRAAAPSSVGALKVQLADTNGYLTGPPSGNLYYDTSGSKLVADALTFGGVDFYASGNERIMEATGNPARRIHIRQVSGGEIHIGDSGLQGNTTIGLMVDENNTQIVSYGDFKILADVGANTAGELTVAAAATIGGDLAVNGADITTPVTGTATLFNTNCTTLNIGQAATAISIGATTGTTTFRNGIVAPTGTATLAPLKFVSGTNLTTPSAGAMEYDGKCFYATTANGRALVPSEHYAVISSTRTISNVNTAQAVFDSANDQITLAAGTTYAFEGFYRIISGTTAHTTNMGFAEASVGTVGTWYWMALCHTSAATTVSRAQDTVVLTSATVNSTTGVVNASSGTALVTIWFRGVVETSTDAVAVTPQICFSAAPGGTNQIGAGSFIRFVPLGSDTVQSVGPWA